MVLPIKINNNLATLLVKYSDVEITKFFNTQANLKLQISTQYRNNLPYRAKIIQNIIDRHIIFRDALIDPNNPTNIKIIEDHQKYFWNPNIIENGQIRGPQIHLSHQMFSDFGFANNGIQYSGLNGVHLGSLYNTVNPSLTIHVPSTVLIASPHSFRQAFEYSGARISSSILNKEIHLTDDNSSNLPKCNVMHNNMPKTQKVGDFGIYHDKQKGIISQTDAKNQVLEAAIRNNEPRTVYVGTVDFSEEKASIRYLAHLAIIGSIDVMHDIVHVDPQKNTLIEKYKILSEMNKTGLVEDSINLLGVFSIISNRHNDS